MVKGLDNFKMLVITFNPSIPIICKNYESIMNNTYNILL